VNEPTVSTTAAAKALGISRATLLRWEHAGHVKAAWIAPSGQYRWNMNDLRRQLEKKDVS